MQKALVLIPAYNEAAVIGSLVQRIRQTPLPVRFDILVVDDGSRDATAAVARAAGAQVLSLIQNLGYGYAIQTGYTVALARDYDFVIQMDGDGQHDPQSIETLIAPIIEDKADVVVGSRALSHVPYPMPLARRIGQRIFSALLFRLSGLSIGDPTSGFQVISRRALPHYVTDDFPGDYPDTDVLLYLRLHGLRVMEMPAVFRVREQGQSMHGGILKPAYYVYKMTFSMLTIYFRYRHLNKEPAK